MLVPISADEAVAAGIGEDEGETLKAHERDGRVTLVFSGYTFTRQP